MNWIRFAASAAIVGAAWVAHPAMSDGFGDGPEWVEETDAGSLPGGAQQTFGNGQMQGISGTIGGASSDGVDEVDMYFIRIVDVPAFNASTWNELNGFAEFNSTLWLFEIVSNGTAGGTQALGLLANDDLPGAQQGESLLLPVSNDGSNARVSEPGLYLLAITKNSNACLSVEGFIFDFVKQTEISGPDGPGGNFPINEWTGEIESDGVLSYRIALRGVEFGIPAPAPLALLGLGALLGARRRRD